MKKLRLYLDSCCFNRPFDDLSQEKIRLEFEALVIIIGKCENGDWDILASDVLDDEIDRTTNPIKKQKIKLLYSSTTTKVEINDEIISRAKELQSSYGIRSFDALHLASAEYGKADVLLSTDRKFVSKALGSNSKVRVENPAIWLMEVLFYD